MKGLGKTVTALALITSTAGTLPTIPAIPISISAADVQESWEDLCRSQLRRGELTEIVRRLAVDIAVENPFAEVFAAIAKYKSAGILDSKQSFERQGNYSL